MTLRQLAGSALLLPALVLGAGLVAACGALDVSDPTRIDATDLNNRTSADLQRKDAIRTLAVALGRGVLSSGVLADEFLSDPDPSSTTSDEEVLDRRQSLQYEQLVSGLASDYGAWHAVRLAATVALPQLRTYMPDPPRPAYVGQILAVRGFATLQLGEHFCPGFPLHDVVDYKLVYGPPRTTTEVFQQALADFDSAVVYAADTARFLDFARVGRGRTLLGLGRFADAAATVAPVPTAYVWNAEYSNRTGPSHSLAFTRSGGSWRSVVDREGGTGLDYIAANDPRVQVTLLGPAHDGITGIYAMGKYPTPDAPIVVASGIEARLIEAEAALRAGQPQWLTILNDLRQTQITPPMSPLADPGTEAARVDLLFRERAFWLFATGHRLGDLRRLVQHYGRAPETVFPSGAFRLGGLYGTGTSIPFPAMDEAAYNPAVTGCTSR
jgi:hypothetical protein